MVSSVKMIHQVLLQIKAFIFIFWLCMLFFTNQINLMCLCGIYRAKQWIRNEQMTNIILVWSFYSVFCFFYFTKQMFADVLWINGTPSSWNRVQIDPFAWRKDSFCPIKASPGSQSDMFSCIWHSFKCICRQHNRFFDSCAIAELMVVVKRGYLHCSYDSH